MSERECPLCHEILGHDAPEAKPYLDYGYTRIPVESASAAKPEPLYRIIFATALPGELPPRTPPQPWREMLHLLRLCVRRGRVDPRLRPVRVEDAAPGTQP
jgi:hypothetical protein